MEIRDALETTATKAKMCHYEKFDIHLTECELAGSQNFYFNKMRNAAEQMPITGLLPVKLCFKIYYLIFITFT